MARRYGPRPLDWALLRADVEIIRGTPFLVQLFLLYYGGPFIGLSLDAHPGRHPGLSIYGAAYFARSSAPASTPCRRAISRRPTAWA